jgi:Peptidase family M28
VLDPRIYRTGLVAVVLAVIVLAFSLENQQGPMTTTLSSEAFNGGHAYATMNRLAEKYPNRRPGSTADDAIATEVGKLMARNGFFVSRSEFSAQTADGRRTLRNVTATRPGLTSGTIVVVAHRDALDSPATTEASGTAVLEELARVLAGETHHHTIVLASTSGSTGAAGANELARSLAQPVDGVVVLGDLAGSGLRQPVVVPWSNDPLIAPPELRNTAANALSQQARLTPGSSSIDGQFAHLAFPFTTTEQGPFGAHGQSAVSLSVSGERPPAADEPTSAARISAMGRTVLQTINALDGGASVPGPSAYLLFDRKVVPAWAIRLFVLALIVPVAMATVDGIARVRRRGHPVLRWAVWVLCAGIPFVIALLLVLAVRLVGLIHAAPPGPVGADGVPPHGTGIAILAVLACAILLCLVVLRPVVIRLARLGAAGLVPERSAPGAAAGLMLVLCVVTLAIWASNPFAAALLVPALHFWLWIVAPDLRLRRPIALAMLLAGLAAPVLVIVYYAIVLGLGPIGLAWNAVLLIAGGHVSALAAVEWSVVVGCALSLILIGARSPRNAPAEERPVTIRGPVTYAGPGSLGGTKSALRR